jgi:hypothetical protein
MNVRVARACSAVAAVAIAAATAGCNRVVTRVNPEQVGGGRTAKVVVKMAGGASLPADTTPTLKIVDGEECGTVDTTAVKQDDGRWAVATFTANASVENCVATIQASVGTRSSTTRALVNRFDPRLRIDGVSAIAAILIASFAIDRVTTGILAFYSWIRRRVRRTRDAPDPFAADGGRRAPYFVVAGLLGAVVLGGFGDVRVLAALGFVSVNPYLDALITGLVLMVGADRASDLLQRFDVPGAGGSKKPAAPIEVTGKLVLENPDAQRRDHSVV